MESHERPGRLAHDGWVAGLVRPLAGCVAAGIVVGFIVAGLGSRLVMRALAIVDSDATGTFTENGNQVGDITLDGTLGLVMFIGVPSGVAAGRSDGIDESRPRLRPADHQPTSGARR
jgi:hypothetical protein